ncbi:MAG: hypothetical protein FJ333_03370 [Sphingomonadales bacterium]|nr:hypothetical protein [Sphingomonadales bacterium]
MVLVAKMCTFFKNANRKSKSPGLGNRSSALSLIRFSLISALLKKAIERSLAHLLIKKERMSNRSFLCSLQKSQ